MLDKRVKELLDKLLKITSENNIHFAIGGGIAMNVYNVERYTADVDAFFKHEDRVEVLRALRQSGFDVCKVFAPNHYVAFLSKHNDPRIRIDLLFPEGEPEISAIENPVMINKWDMTIPVFRIELLVLSKFYSNQPLDKWDIASLYIIGAFEETTVKYLLSKIDPEQVDEFVNLIDEIRQKTGSPRKRPPRRQ